MRAASTDIIVSWRQKCLADKRSDDPEIVERAAQNMFWLSKWTFSKVLGSMSTAESLGWLLEAAGMGSIEARAVVYNIFSALGQDIPSKYRGPTLQSWLIDACEKNEHPAEFCLKELFPESYPKALENLRTIYCGYGQDCFGERWRNQYPLSEFEHWTDEALERSEGLNELHEFPGLACGLTWLHYAASSGRLDAARYLVDRGSDPNVVSEYGETPLFMACQAGHHEMAQYLVPLTRTDVQEYSTFTELHFLDRFDEERIEELTQILLGWGVDINNTKGERGQSPLASVLNHDGPNCNTATLALLKFGADPALKDDNGLDCIAHAACNLSAEMTRSLLEFVATECQAEVKANALWFLLEMDECEMLVRGGKDIDWELEQTLRLLLDPDSSDLFVQKTYHPLFIFACAKAPIQAVRKLARLSSSTDWDLLVESAEEWRNPLFAAVVQDRPIIVEWLLDNGSDWAAALPKSLWTPLFYAVTRSPETVKLIMKMVESKASRHAAIEYVNLRDDAGVTAFDIAVVGEFFEAADILSRYQPDFLACTIPYSEDSSTLYNMLGHTCYMADQLLYLLNLVPENAGMLAVDNDGVTLLHAVCGVPFGRYHDKLSRRTLD